MSANFFRRPAMTFNLCILFPTGYPHFRVFDELAQLLCYSLRALGHRADIRCNEIDRSAVNIIFGVHFLHAGLLDGLPADTVLLNTEQLDALRDGDAARRQWYGNIIAAAQRFAVWDYSRRNLDTLHAEGIDAKLWTIGHRPEMARIQTASVQDVDVLFYGSSHLRRQRIFNQLAARGLRVKTLFGVYGAERDRWIARAKTVLNVHAYDAHIFEIVRCSYLMSNGICTVSEINDQTDIAPAYRLGLAAAPYHALAETCAELAADDTLRALYGRLAFETISRLPQHLLTAQTLEQTFG